jgi:hypothetical protein
MKNAFVRFHEDLNDYLKILGTYPATHDQAVDAFQALGSTRAGDAAKVIFAERQDAEIAQDLANLPSPSYVDLCLETAYGVARRLPFQIRVF